MPRLCFLAQESLLWRAKVEPEEMIPQRIGNLAFRPYWAVTVMICLARTRKPCSCT